MDLIEHTETFVSSGRGQGFAIRRDQEVPDDFLAHLRDVRADSVKRATNYHQVASVPTALAELWMAQGFNIYQEPASAIVARLRRDNLDAFITTSKRV